MINVRNDWIRKLPSVLVIMSGLYSPMLSGSLEQDQGPSDRQYADPVRDCALNLLESVRKTGTEAAKLPDLYRKHSIRQDAEFLEYMFSIIYVESAFNKLAVSPAEAYGLMQMTSIAVEESLKHCKLRPLLSMDKLHDSVTNIRYGTCFLKKVLNEVDGDWTRALILYNGGYRALRGYDEGANINQESANYVLKVERARRTICKKVRNSIDTVQGQ